MAALAKFRPVDSSQHDKDELREIVRERSFRSGRYTLSSGIESDIYFNMKPTMMMARGAQLAALEFLKIAEQVKAEYVGGLEMGAVPVIGSMAAVSSAMNKPINTIFVRKTPKSHGTRDAIEGLGPKEDLEGKVVLIVDDVATSGKSILKAIEEVRRVGGIVGDAACLVDRDEGATALLAQHGVTLHSVLHASEFVERH
ncbi:MAG: orotate phosphoribosyltransferase [Mesorhizobium sp.]|uniref:orotate phosphoribosyltransferase n=1 Tax=Mesorhizobium TaxID=68287 RepID=UPI000FE9F35E|nr:MULTISPECIES: orotate phosphoribosyltransferase [Mesorhizobium]MCF6120319.1 orotate phosphoribosyltransferase [Mesorhizobium muleiense]RWE98060.1 MAG: orotate phosphoribosyltransferase [Mesorhizobium sp.]RWI44292.1 MAG: orotate phosphoribosyltransferase [Mesorhizobium sp.]RWJ21381.1 MAG: orotate phosphoribosyltransferase [Mesorhizobium sp.]RWJ85560.1 MAG: orotate phosphoribosyltransferase [Mesorhizobium sp.]